VCVHEHVHVQLFLLYVCTGACIRVPVVFACMYICLLSKSVCAHAYVSLACIPVSLARSRRRLYLK